MNSESLSSEYTRLFLQFSNNVPVGLCWAVMFLIYIKFKTNGVSCRHCLLANDLKLYISSTYENNDNDMVNFQETVNFYAI